MSTRTFQTDDPATLTGDVAFNKGNADDNTERVVLADDQSIIPVKLAADVMSAAGVDLTPKFVAIAASSSGNNTILAAVTGKHIRVLALYLVANGSVNAKWQSGAGGTDLTGLAYLIANSGMVLPFNPVGWFQTAVNTLLNLNLSGAVAVGGTLVYVEVA